MVGFAVVGWGGKGKGGGIMYKNEEEKEKNE